MFIISQRERKRDQIEEERKVSNCNNDNQKQKNNKKKTMIKYMSYTIFLFIGLKRVERIGDSFKSLQLDQITV